MYLSFNSLNGEDQASAVSQVEACVSEIDKWMVNNKLKLNGDKTELLIISSKHRPRPCFNAISVCDHYVQPSVSARNIGVVFDNSFSFVKHVSAVCKSAFYHLRNIAKIREYLSDDCTETLVHAFVTCKLDNCNALLYGLPKCLTQKLQSVQNCAARLVSRNSKFTRITPVLRGLHWLPIEKRVIFKVLLLTYKALNNLAPTYISELINRYNPSRHLRSSDQCLLASRKSKLKSYGDRAFSVAAPRLWNALPSAIRFSSSLNLFKSRLKSHLFKESYL